MATPTVHPYLPSSSQEKQLLAPYAYVHDTLGDAGHDFCRLFLQIFNHWFKLTEKQSDELYENFIAIFHVVMLIDDIEDSSPTRRGHQTAHNIFGIKATFNCANYVAFKNLKYLIAITPPDRVAAALRVYTKWGKNLWIGQGADIFNRDSNVVLTEDQYVFMVRGKSKAFFMIYHDLMKVFSDEKGKDYTELMDNWFVYIQMRDDFLAMTSDEYHKSKGGYCTDITEGKFSFPLAYTISHHPDRAARLCHILRKRTLSLQLKQYVVEQLKEVGAFEYTQKRLKNYMDWINKEIARLGGNPHFEAYMEKDTADWNIYSIF